MSDPSSSPGGAPDFDAAVLSNTSLARRLFDAQHAYVMIHQDLDAAVMAIFGIVPKDSSSWDRSQLENWSVEQDSAYDNSIEISLYGNEKVTDEQRKSLLALGFSIVWNDQRSKKESDTFSERAHQRLLAESLAQSSLLAEAREVLKPIASHADGGSVRFSNDVDARINIQHIRKAAALLAKLEAR